MGVESLNINVRDINVASKHTTAFLYCSLGKINLLIAVQLRYFGAYAEPTTAWMNIKEQLSAKTHEQHSPVPIRFLLKRVLSHRV